MLRRRTHLPILLIHNDAPDRRQVLPRTNHRRRDDDLRAHRGRAEVRHIQTAGPAAARSG